MGSEHWQNRTAISIPTPILSYVRPLSPEPFFVVVLKKLTNNKFTKVLMKVRGLESGREWRLEPDASSLAIL